MFLNRGFEERGGLGGGGGAPREGEPPAGPTRGGEMGTQAEKGGGRPPRGREKAKGGGKGKGKKWGGKGAQRGRGEKRGRGDSTGPKEKGGFFGFFFF